jgi:hypothetical protein
MTSQVASQIFTLVLLSGFALPLTHAATDSILEQIAQLALSAAVVGGRLKIQRQTRVLW